MVAVSEEVKLKEYEKAARRLDNALLVCSLSNVVEMCYFFKFYVTV